VPNVPPAQKSFWTHPMILLGDEAQVEACLSPFGDVLILSKIGAFFVPNEPLAQKIILNAPDGTSR
jgi:hypothetical protein